MLNLMVGQFGELGVSLLQLSVLSFRSGKIAVFITVRAAARA